MPASVLRMSSSEPAGVCSTMVMSTADRHTAKARPIGWRALVLSHRDVVNVEDDSAWSPLLRGREPPTGTPCSGEGSLAAREVLWLSAAPSRPRSGPVGPCPVSRSTQFHLDAITNNVANADTTTTTPGSSPAINGTGR
jgi:hypothetical protein